MDRANRNMLNWIGIVFVLFPLLLIAGMFLRAIQANTLHSAESWFYPMMTLHGIGMASVWWIAAMAVASHVLSRYVEPSQKVSRFVFYGTIIGVVILLVSVFGGRFAAGWYFLYPLPFKSQGAWPQWATLCFLISLTVCGIVWFIWTLDLLRAIAKKYTLSQALGWHFIRGKSEPDVPPAILITTTALIPAVACFLSAVIVLLLYYYETLTGTRNDELLMKNLTFFFGHLIVNLSLYLAVAAIYDSFPKYTGREWHSGKIVAIAWNVVLVIVLLAYFHHLYMDFVQPKSLQYIGQIASYISGIPSAVVTVFGAMAIVYRAPVKWSLGFSLLFFGMMGWGIGGIGAVIDSTIAVNSKFHNTLWVPAHFHSYMIEGLVLMALGYFYHYCQEKANIPENLKFHKLIVWLMLVGGYGFLLMFYLSGAKAIPRRFAFYPAELSHGALFSAIGLVFMTAFLIGLLLYIYETGKRWKKARAL